ncbi:hypothetical protein CAL7716_053390 [Calothrix sp. PCC 7716]|nr:hypothetical protein CAL7716_053390 [Calothrix sp. PCC 7716]
MNKLEKFTKSIMSKIIVKRQAAREIVGMFGEVSAESLKKEPIKSLLLALLVDEPGTLEEKVKVLETWLSRALRAKILK